MASESRILGFLRSRVGRAAAVLTGALIAVAVDQLAKYYVATAMEVTSLPIANVLFIEYRTILSPLRIATVGAASVLLGLTVWCRPLLPQIALATLFAGSASNVLSRMVSPRLIVFLRVAGSDTSFNLADVFISAGVLVLLALGVRALARKWRERNESRPTIFSQ